MEGIGYLHLASVYEASESIEVVPYRVNFQFWNWKKLPSSAAMRLLSVALTMSLLSLAGQALAIQKVGDNGAEVTFIQKCLTKLGYYRGPVTGKFGSLTQQGVISFQQANKLPADGVVGTGSQRILQQACQIRTQGHNVSKTSIANLSSELRLGSRGPAVSQLQQRLQKLGYFNGPITGYYGPKTQQAVIRSQQSGRTSSNTIVPVRTRQASFNNPSIGGEYPVLLEGSTGAAVTRLQQRLQQLGYFHANPTGHFRRITKDAVIAFQRNAGIPADGIVHQQTWNALLGYSQSQTPTYGNTSTPISQTVYSPPTRNYLTIGDSGQNVKAVQERLLQLGFFNANPDGYFGENTRAYVYSFQQYSRLNPTGNVDAQTWQALGLNTSPVDNRANQNRYVVIVPIRNGDTLNQVRQYMPNAVVDKSGLGDYVNAGAFGDRATAENQSKILRSYGLDARVQFF